MKNSLKAFAVVSVVAMTSLFTLSAFAQLVEYKSASASKTVLKLTDSSVDKLVNSNDPLCIKDGNKIKSVNKAFEKKGLRYGDCSNSEAARERQGMKGYTVNVLKLEQISKDKAKSLGLI